MFDQTPPGRTLRPNEQNKGPAKAHVGNYNTGLRVCQVLIVILVFGKAAFDFTLSEPTTYRHCRAQQ